MSLAAKCVCKRNTTFCDGQDGCFYRQSPNGIESPDLLSVLQLKDHITKLEAKISEQESYIMDSGANYLKSTDELFDRIRGLEARNKELEEALQKIVDFDYVPHKMAYDVMGEVEEIATQALRNKQHEF